MKNRRNGRGRNFGGKLLSLSLAVMLLLTALAACAGDGDTPADTTAAPASTAAPTETTAPDADPAAIYTAPDVDYNGREFLFSSWKTSSPNWIATSYFECEAENLNGDIINDAIYTRNLKVEEALGVTIKAIEYSSTSQMINATAAGDHFADTVLFEGLTVGSTASQGLFRDLREIPTLDLRKVWWDQNAMDALGYYGREEVHTALIEETITYKTVRDADTEEMLNIIYDNRYYDLESVFEWGVSKLLRSMINENRTNFASSYSQMERVFRATIENTNKQYMD